MAHPSTILRREMKLKDPAKYEAMREKARQRDNARNAEKRRKRDAGEFSQAEMDEMEQKRLENK